MSLETAKTLARALMQDHGLDFSATAVGDGTIARYTLPVENVDPTAIQVWEDAGSGPVTLASTAYRIDEYAGTITLLDGPLAANTTLIVNGKSYLFPGGDFATFLDIAMDLHAKGRVPALTWDNVSSAEEYVITLLAIRESIWSQISEAASEVDVTTPEGMHIPAGQHFQQLMALLDRFEAHYREFAQALNVGPWAIEMFTLRRVSRTTNRLVPVYVPREFDDHSPPVRVLPPINPGI